MDFTLLGVAFGKTQTFRKGSESGPDYLRAAFPKLETFVSGVDLSGAAFIKDLGNVSADTVDELKIRIASKLTIQRGFPIILGGEHTITSSCVENIRPQNLVVFDAHPDCEDSGGHDGFLRALIEKKIMPAKNVFLFGIRTMSAEENKFLKDNKIKIVKFPSDLKKIKGTVYLSVDLDVLDPSIMPAVGNPEPDGKSFSEVLEAIKILAPKLVAADFVEFTPLGLAELDEIYAGIAGKLIYGIIAEIIKSQK